MSANDPLANRRRINSPVRVERRLNRPGGIFEPDASSKCHAPPRPAVELDEPGNAVGVAEHFEHEHPVPTNALDETACRTKEILGNPSGGAGARTRTVGIDHPESAMRTPSLNACRGCQAEQAFVRPAKQRLCNQHSIAEAFERFVELPVVGANRRPKTLQAAGSLFSYIRGLEDEGIVDVAASADFAGSTDLRRRHGKAGRDCMLDLQLLVEGEANV